MLDLNFIIMAYKAQTQKTQKKLEETFPNDQNKAILKSLKGRL